MRLRTSSRTSASVGIPCSLPTTPEEHDTLLYKQSNDNYIVFAYVWNKTDDYCSEFGSIGVKSFGGGIRRVA